jgi:hypothetical protein
MYVGKYVGSSNDYFPNYFVYLLIFIGYLLNFVASFLGE